MPEHLNHPNANYPTPQIPQTPTELQTVLKHTLKHVLHTFRSGDIDHEPKMKLWTYYMELLEPMLSDVLPQLEPRVLAHLAEPWQQVRTNPSKLYPLLCTLESGLEEIVALWVDHYAKQGSRAQLLLETMNESIQKLLGDTGLEPLPGIYPWAKRVLADGMGTGMQVPGTVAEAVLHLLTQEELLETMELDEILDIFRSGYSIIQYISMMHLQEVRKIGFTLDFEPMQYHYEDLELVEHYGTYHIRIKEDSWLHYARMHNYANGNNFRDERGPRLGCPVNYKHDTYRKQEGQPNSTNKSPMRQYFDWFTECVVRPYYVKVLGEN